MKYYKWKMAVSKSLDWEINSHVITKNCIGRKTNTIYDSFILLSCSGASKGVRVELSQGSTIIQNIVGEKSKNLVLIPPPLPTPLLPFRQHEMLEEIVLNENLELMST